MPFNPFRASRPRMIYVPDPFGRVGQGEWVTAAARDPFGRVAADDPDDTFDFSDPFHPAAAVGSRGRNAPNDVANLEGLLRLAGDMDLAPTDGPTGYFGARLDDATRAFQRRKGLAVDGAVHPGGETLRALAHHLQAMGRNGDTVLAHLTPEEARYLHAVTDGGTVNPRTGLLEFFDNSKKKGTYIWRTVGDGKVRSSHADRNGKVFSWVNPPEGGHPGEAPNCRCWAEDTTDGEEKKKRCSLLRARLDAARNNRDAAYRRASEAEDNFETAKDRREVTISLVESQAAAVGIDLAMALALRIPPSAPAGLFEAVREFQAADAETEWRLDELHAKRQDVEGADAVTRSILDEMTRLDC